MNRTVEMNGYKKVCEKAERTPLVLVMLARLVIWLMKPEIVRNIKCSLALGCVAVVAVIAGALGAGTVPLLIGGVAAFAFGGLGILITADLN